MSVFNNNSVTSTTQMFLDPAGSIGLQRFDQMRYPIFDKLTKQQMGFFWIPDEVDCSKDAKDFRQLAPHEQHIFTSNIKRQIVLDSVQGRAPSLVFGPLATVPELETWLSTWTFFEGAIHSRSYTHIIQSIYSNPSEVLDEITSIPEILDCANDISKYYDDLAKMNAYVEQNGYGLYRREQHKRSLWLALNAVNALEGVRFYVSFACSWAFAELKKMEGNAKIIKLIARDENLHLASSQHMLKLLPRDDEEFAYIKEACVCDVDQIHLDVVNQEKKWADYLMKDGSIIGVSLDSLYKFAEHRMDKCRRQIGLPPLFEGSNQNPYPWTQKWIAGSDVQVAPQETESTMYSLQVKNNISEDRFAGFEL